MHYFTSFSLVNIPTLDAQIDVWKTDIYFFTSTHLEEKQICMCFSLVHSAVSVFLKVNPFFRPGLKSVTSYEYTFSTREGTRQQSYK